MLWLMVWITCAVATGCYEETVEQEFEKKAECQYALDYYRATYGVNGVCKEVTADG